MTKRAMIIISAILILLIGGSVFYNSGVKISKIRMINEYSDLYWFKMRSMRIISFNFGTGGPPALCRVWFLPGQKQKLLDQIKKDVNDELANVIAEYSNAFQSYEISEDFKKIYIYIYKDATWPYGLIPEDESIKPKVSLYHELIHGWFVSFSKMIEYIEIERD